MTNLRQAAQQALEALESDDPSIQLRAAITLRAALEKPEPVKLQEPVISAWSLREVYFDENGEPLMHRSPPAAQRPWQGLTDEEILSTDPWEILRADPWMGTSDSNINPYQILLKVRILEAKLKERNRGATTHCQCAACKNGNIHDSDCSVHNGDALPVGPCDCSLATPPVQPAEPAQTFYQPAANEAVEILKSLGYVYEPTYTGLAWVAKKSAQPEQKPVVFYRCNGCGHAYEQVHPTSCDCMDAGGFDRVEYFTTPPAAQRPWVGLEIEEVQDSYNADYQAQTRAIEAKLKERNT